jgi:hypothetical protein
MKVLQVDSKTIKIEKNGYSFLVSYSFVWSDRERKPESINLDGNTVNAFFLTSVIKDYIIEEELGFTIKRIWKIVPTDKIALPFSLEIPIEGDIPFMFPCIHAGDKVPREKIAFFGERLAYPSSVFLFTGKSCMFIHTDPPKTDDEQSSISICRPNPNLLKVEINFPPIEIFPESIKARPEFKSGPLANSFDSPGNMIKEHNFNVLLYPEKTILPQALTAVRKKIVKDRSTNPQQIKADAIRTIKEGIQKCISELITEGKGVFGLLPYSKAPFISANANIGLAVLIQKVYNFDSIKHETSLKLADFVLKGQHPNGIFYTHYSLVHKDWFGENIPVKFAKDDKKSDLFKVSLPMSGMIVNRLLTFSNLLMEKNIQNKKYFFAGKRFMEALFDPKKKLMEMGSAIKPDSLKTFDKDLTCLEFIFPLKKIFKLTENEMYKKAITSIKNEFFPAALPHVSKLIQIREDTAPSFEAILLLLKSTLILEEQGATIRDKESLVHRILPWIYYNRTTVKTQCATIGGILDSFDKCRIRSQGYELAYYLLKFKALLESKDLIQLLDEIVLDILDFASQVPIGSPFINHSAWSLPDETKKTKDCPIQFNALVFLSEANFLLRLLSEFPDFFK